MCLPHHRGGDEISSRSVFSPLTVSVPGRQQASTSQRESNQVRPLTELFPKAQVTMWDTQNLEETLKRQGLYSLSHTVPQAQARSCSLGCITVDSGGFQFLKTGVRVLRT